MIFLINLPILSFRHLYKQQNETLANSCYYPVKGRALNVFWLPSNSILCAQEHKFMTWDSKGRDGLQNQHFVNKEGNVVSKRDLQRLRG